MPLRQCTHGIPIRSRLLAFQSTRTPHSRVWRGVSKRRCWPKAMREQEEGQGGSPSRPRRRFASSPASGRFARTFSASSGSVSHTRTNQVPGAGSSTPSVRTPPRAKLKGISEASSGGARDYARMHCTVMHCHRWLWSRASFAFWRGGSPRKPRTAY